MLYCLALNSLVFSLLGCRPAARQDEALQSCNLNSFKKNELIATMPIKPKTKTASDDLLMYTKMVDFLSWLFPILNTFPKSQRMVFAQAISNSALTCLRLIVSARNARLSRRKASILFELNVELECLRKLLTVAHQIGFLSAKRTENGMKQLMELGKMCGGWLKRYE